MEQVRGWGLGSWTVLPRGCSRSRASARVLACGPDTPARFLLQGTPCGWGPTCSTQGPSTLTLQRALLLSSQTWAAADFTFPYFIYNQKHQLPPAQGPHQALYGGGVAGGSLPHPSWSRPALGAAHVVPCAPWPLLRGHSVRQLCPVWGPHVATPLGDWLPAWNMAGPRPRSPLPSGPPSSIPRPGFQGLPLSPSPLLGLLRFPLYPRRHLPGEEMR